MSLIQLLPNAALYTFLCTRQGTTQLPNDDSTKAIPGKFLVSQLFIHFHTACHLSNSGTSSMSWGFAVPQRSEALVKPL